MNADGSGPRNLTRNPGNDGGVGGISGAAWSPDGRRILFASTRDTRDDDNPELYVMNADGSNMRRLTRRPGFEGFLSWSPDGRRIAFSDYAAKPRWAFFVMNADGSGVRQVNWALPGKR
jgi:TolB protein